MTPNTPTFGQALLHLLVATMGFVYLVVAGLQINRGNQTAALVDLLIAAGIAFIVHKGKMAHGRAFSHFTLRLNHSRLKSERTCAWCGESIEAGGPAVSHRGALEGEPFLLHRHRECEEATSAWQKANLTDDTNGLSYPQPGSMQRGGSQPRDTQ